MLGESDQLFSRVVSKEANPSFRVYYGGASGAVPFVWESQPGTPKSTKRHCDTSLPPALTPPPSYQNPNQFRESPKAKSSRLQLLGRMFTRLVNINGKKPRVSSSESCYSSSSSLWTPAQSHHRRRRPQSPLSSFDSSWSSFRGADEEEERPISILCFGRGSCW